MITSLFTVAIDFRYSSSAVSQAAIACRTKEMRGLHRHPLDRKSIMSSPPASFCCLFKMRFLPILKGSLFPHGLYRQLALSERIDAWITAPSNGWKEHNPTFPILAYIILWFCSDIMKYNQSLGRSFLFHKPL